MTCCVYDKNDQAPLDSLLRHFSVALPDIPYEVALDLVRQRYIELCRKSSILEYHFELPIQKDVANYFLEPPDGYEIYKITGVGNPHNMKWMGPTPNRWFYCWGYAFTVIGNTEVVFDTAPTREETGKFVKFALLPTECCDTLPQSIATPFGRAIADGAIATALLMPNKAWTNANLATTYERKFNIAAMAARNLVLTERGAKPAEFKPVRIL